VVERAFVNIEDMVLGSGGGIHCRQSYLDIKNCRITNNRAVSGLGGGIFMDIGVLQLSNSIISNNLSGFVGSGLFFGFYVQSGTAKISNNVFENDTSFYLLGGADSGPVECNGCSLLVFDGNLISNNLSYRVGATKLKASTAIITDNIVHQNLGWAGRSGFWIDIVDSGIVAYNKITNNGNVNSGGFEGSGLILFGSNIAVFNNSIAFNATGSFAGGVYLVGTSNLLLNNILSYNESHNGGGIYIDNTSSQTANFLTNNIIWGNVAPNNPQISNEGNRPLTVSYCDIDGGWQGVGNIDIDPLFRDTASGDFHLMSTFCGDPYDSPCIDAGDPTIQDYLLNCAWGLGSQLSDMGAYGGGDSILQAIGEQAALLPDSPFLLYNYPNPFNSSTAIEFYLPEDVKIELSIYNLLGQEIAVIYKGLVASGEHTISWNAASYPSGIYFAGLKAGSRTITRKMVYLK
jgi:hypothetical protein